MTASSPTILLLSESDNSANIDRRALRAAGYGSCQVMTSGEDAAHYLADSKDQGLEPDLVICSSNLSDMDGARFCSIVREHPVLKSLPILLVISDGSEKDRLKFIDCGANAFLTRPYSAEDLGLKLQQLLPQIAQYHSQKKAISQPDTEDFEAALATQGVLLRSERDPKDYFKLGMRLLNENRLSLALAAFDKALVDPQIRAEVELGKAAVAKAMGDQALLRSSLIKAVETFVSEERWNRARSAYARLLQQDPKVKNPFLSEAHRLIRLGEYGEAARALLQGHNFIPKMQVADRYAQICMTAKDPCEMLDALNRELHIEGEEEYFGADIRSRLQTLLKEKMERQKEQAEERTWKLAQTMGGKEKVIIKDNQAVINAPGGSPKKEPAPVKAPSPKQAPGKPRQAAKTVKTELFPMPDDIYEDEVAEYAAREATDADLFQNRSFLGDLISMMRLTWRLNKHSKKK